MRGVVFLSIAIEACLLSGCGRTVNPSSVSAPKTKSAIQTTDDKPSLWSPDPAQRAQARLAIMAKLHEAVLSKPELRRVPLPNFPSTPGQPRPVGINYYQLIDAYPDYLLCVYDVEENHYDASNEPGWFASALLQIRGNTRGPLPPFVWVAVIISNRAEQKDASTLEKSRKVGAVFNAVDVIDPTVSPTRLIAEAEIDRHPFVYDPTRRTLAERQRWPIVERHARSHPASPSK